MTFLSLALIAVVALAGPLLALPVRWRLPVMLGELLAGIAIGRSGLALVDPADPTFSLPKVPTRSSRTLIPGSTPNRSTL